MTGAGRERRIRIGTRASALARTQTEWVAARLRELGHDVAVETVATSGDARTDVPIAGIGGDGVFVRELEAALLDGRIDAAVHSLKDLPTAETPGLALTCVPTRANPFDVLVSPRHATLAALPSGAVVGTSSVRRVAQVRALRGDLVVRGIRGNVDTRLRKLDAGEYDAIVLAAAGLERLGLAERIGEILAPPTFWPAVAQGALVVQTRADDAPVRTALEPLDDAAAHREVRAERSCLAALAGGCLAPIGGWAHHDARGRLRLGACVLEELEAGVRRLVAEEQAAPETPPEVLGRLVALRLRDLGADAALARTRGQNAGERAAGS